MSGLTSQELQEQAEIRLEAEKARARKDWRALLCTAQGRRIIQGILQACHDNMSAFSSDPLRMAYHCALRDLANSIKANVEEVSPQYLIQMKEEFMAEILQKDKQAKEQYESTL